MLNKRLQICLGTFNISPSGEISLNMVDHQSNLHLILTTIFSFVKELCGHIDARFVVHLAESCQDDFPQQDVHEMFILFSLEADIIEARFQKLDNKIDEYFV